MKYKIETKTTLISDNNKRFYIGNDIAFTIFNKKTKHYDKYIGEIRSISNDKIIINKIEINREYIGGYKEIKLNDIESNSCDYVSAYE